MNFLFYLVLFLIFVIFMFSFLVDAIYRKNNRTSMGYYYDDGGSFFGGLLRFISVVGTAVFIVAATNCQGFETRECEYKVESIRSLALGNETEGHFCLGCRTVNELPMYFMYKYDTGLSYGGGYGLFSVSAKHTHTVLLEDGGDDPYIEIPYKIKLKDPSRWAASFRTKKRLDDLATNGRNYFSTQDLTSDGDIAWTEIGNRKFKVILHVPENTIKREFNADVNNL